MNSDQQRSIQRVTAQGAPKPQGPYSHAVKAGGFVYVSGQAALDPATSKPIHGTVAEETRRTLENVMEILEAAGASLEDVVKCSVFLADIRDFAAMNAVYAEYFDAAKPARTTVQAVLPAAGLKVEIDCIAYVGD
ncbi:MAG: Rid family detoxifying hydrolase [Bryobacterales bacterium]|nr:Rid family detoxifying hydrolase [Bryobacterales bacterium]